MLWLVQGPFTGVPFIFLAASYTVSGPKVVKVASDTHSALNPAGRKHGDVMAGRDNRSKMSTGG